MTVPITSIVSVLFCEVRMQVGALCPSLHTPCSVLFTDWLRERFGGAETEVGGGAGGQCLNHRSLVHNTSQHVNMERTSLKGNLLIVSPPHNRTSTVAAMKNEVGRDSTGQKQSSLCLRCIWVHLSVGIASLPAGL